MWVMTTKGMISCVRHREDENIIIVRARSFEHLTSLFPEKEDDIYFLYDADYNYRLDVYENELKDCLDKYIENDLDYDNFKDAVEKCNPNDIKYLDALHNTWHIFFAIFKDFKWLKSSTTG